MTAFVDKTKQFEKACKTMENIRQAAKAGDKEAQQLLEFSEKLPAAFLMADLSKYRPK
jgi:hypothetical protein